MKFLLKVSNLIPVVVVALLLVGPIIGIPDAMGSRHIMLIAVLALMVSGLNLVLGYAGELAVGQVAFYAVGAYVAGFVGTNLGRQDLLIGIVAVVLAAIILGIVTGVPSLRLSGWPLAMVTFFLVLITPNLIEVTSKWTGGSQGMPVDRATFFGQEIGPYGYYCVVIAVAATWFFVIRNTIKSPNGTGFLVLKQSRELAGSLGLSVYRTKLKVYTLGTIAPALAGALFAWMDGFIAPDSFTFGLAITLLAASVLGGSESIYGAILGATVLHFAEDYFSSFNEYQLIVFGLLLIVLSIILPDGITGLLKSRFSAFSRNFRGKAAASKETPKKVQFETLVEPGFGVQIRGVSKTFGGNRAVDDVTLDADPGEITALIGTNGSGKTTLLNMVNGFTKPDNGQIKLVTEGESVDLTKNTVDGNARIGLARTFQTPIMPAHVKVIDFVALGGYLREPRSFFSTIFRLPKYRKQISRQYEEAAALLRQLGLERHSEDYVDSLPLGNRRMVEVARAIAARPKLLLLDEVASGLDANDLSRLENVLNAIRAGGISILLVEHNFPFIMRIADHVHVLVRGRTLTEGSPAAVRSDSRVASEYLGKPLDRESKEHG